MARSGDWGFDDGDDDKPRMRRNADGFLQRSDMRYEFDCPECDANNPWGDGFGDQSEIQCHYCNESFIVTFAERNRLKFKII